MCTEQYVSLMERKGNINITNFFINRRIILKQKIDLQQQQQKPYTTKRGQLYGKKKDKGF